MIRKSGLILALGVLLLVGTTVSVLAFAGAQPIGDSLHEKIRERASQGDEWATAVLRELDAVLSRQGKTTPVEEREVRAQETVAGVRVGVKGIEPFFLKLYNDEKFENVDDLERYVSNRRNALNTLAEQDASRQIEVCISPQTYVNLVEMWRLKEGSRLDVDEMIVTLFLNGRRHSVMGVSDPKDPGEGAYVDFNASADALEARLRQMIPAGAFGQGTVGPADLQLKVEWARGKMRASDALALASSPMIALVDPTTDIVDNYRGRAVEVGMVTMPHLLSIRERLDPSTRPPMVETQPVNKEEVR